MSDQIQLSVEELEERIAPEVLGGGKPAQSANPENTANPEGSAAPWGAPWASGGQIAIASRVAAAAMAENLLGRVMLRRLGGRTYLVLRFGVGGPTGAGL